MTIKTTRWRPDTCECVIEYTWDDTIPIVDRILTLDTVTRRCVAHQSMDNDSIVYTSVKSENSKKNQTHQLLLDNAPNSVYDILEDGTRTFKKGITLAWTWSGESPNRILTIMVTGITLTTNQKNTIQTKLNERFGISNVVIV